MKTDKQAVWSLEQLRRADLGNCIAWITPSITELAARELSLVSADPNIGLPDRVDTLIVIGGGTLIDRAKATARATGKSIRLVAVPSIWGSGAEVSPVVVLDSNGRKQIMLDEKFVPDVRVHWPELATTLPSFRARLACGDVWSHALEGFLSPLASDELRDELSILIGKIIELKLSPDPSWFEASTQACAGQARSSVGLIHGIAHTLESVLRGNEQDDGWHHAKLCSIFLLPVISYNRDTSDKWNMLINQYGLDEKCIFGVLEALFDPEAYRKALTALTQCWHKVVRDPCTRTNSVLVRPSSLEYFQNYTV